MKRLILAGMLALGACSTTPPAAQIQNVTAAACQNFRAAEANPVVQAALPIGEAAAGVALGSVTAGVGAPVPGIVVASIKSFGDNYCASGAPPGDTTTPEQQAQWLAGVTAKMVAAASRAR